MNTLQRLPLDAVIVHCDKPNCYLDVTVYTDTAAAELMNNHKCPQPGGETNYHWEVTLTLVERMWEMADQAYYKLTSPEMQNLTESDYPERDEVRSKLVAYCEMIALFMSPYFSSTKQVADEVVKRKQKIDVGEPYETPGIGNRRFETPPNQPNKYAVTTQHSRPAPPKVGYTPKDRPPPAHSLSPADINSIRDGFATGMMSPEILAGAYDTTVEVIRYVTGREYAAV